MRSAVPFGGGFGHVRMSRLIAPTGGGNPAPASIRARGCDFDVYSIMNTQSLKDDMVTTRIPEAEAVLSCERSAVARALTCMENAHPGAARLHAALLSHAGRAHVVGITGAPGAGKSTLIGALLGSWIASGLRVAVLAVDPSSPVSGGALLGDRIRMAHHGGADSVFIRSLSSRGTLGGLSSTTSALVDVLDAAGFDLVIVETVGVGQSEVDIHRLADTCIVVCPPGLGDEVQAIKAGILEIADILVVNKGDQPGALRTVNELKPVCDRHRDDGWTVEVLRTVATTGDGIAQLVARIAAHRAANGVGRRLRRNDASARVGTVRPSAVASDDELFERIRQWQQDGHGVALATVVRTWGSSPRPAGSHLAANDTCGFIGSVSGGCVESVVITEAQAVIADGVGRMLSFGVSDEQAWEVGLACGGRVQVYVERVAADGLFSRLCEDRSGKRPVAAVTRVADGAKALVRMQDQEGELTLDVARVDEIRALLAAGRSAFLVPEEDGLFVRCHVASARLVIVGAVHIAQALAPMAAIAGYEVIVVDPRRAFADRQRFGGVKLIADWPDDALAGLRLDAQTAVVVLSHDPKIDDPALRVALASDAFYVGALGSVRTHARRVERLGAEGLDEALQRLHAPIGLDLGGRTPAEIAVSILAQVIRARYAAKPSQQRLDATQT